NIAAIAGSKTTLMSAYLLQHRPNNRVQHRPTEGGERQDDDDRQSARQAIPPNGGRPPRIVNVIEWTHAGATIQTWSPGNVGSRLRGQVVFNSRFCSPTTNDLSIDLNPDLFLP